MKLEAFEQQAQLREGKHQYSIFIAAWKSGFVLTILSHHIESD
jgi:hypothetical protein